MKNYMAQKLVYKESYFTPEELLDRVHNGTLHVPDRCLDQFVSEILEIFYDRDEALTKENTV